MDFSLTAEQRDLVDTARAFGAAEIAPYYRARDREAKMDRATLRKMAARLFGIELPESVGGLGQTCSRPGWSWKRCARDLNIGYITITASLLGR